MRFAFDGMVIDAPPARNIRPVPYDPVKDFVPVSVVAGITWVMVVNNDLPAKTVPEFIALAKSWPGRIDYSSGGNGSPHLGLEPIGSPPEQVTQRTLAGLKRMGEVVKRAGIQAE